MSKEEQGIIFDELYLGEGEILVQIGNDTQTYIGKVTLRMVKRTGHLFSVSVKREGLKPRVFNAQHVVCWQVNQ